MVAVTSPPLSLPARPARLALREVGPNWYASVMGTAIVANAGVALPGSPTWLRDACTPVWVLSLLLLAGVLGVRAVRWVKYPADARRDLHDPAVAPFFGCLAMALLAVGAGAPACGRALLGAQAAVGLDAVLWTAGSVCALVVAVLVPYLMVVRHRIGLDDASPVWLLPIVAPMVSAALGPALVPHLPAGQGREALLLGCYAMFGMSLLATLMVLPLVWGRLVRSGPLPVALTPALFLVLGPLGQSTTAVGNLADAAPAAVPAPYATALHGFALLYGVPVMGFALLWLAISLSLVVRAFRHGMRFSMTWWAFTFPVGTCVTGAASLARHTGLHPLSWLAVALYAALALTWLTAATCTLRSTLRPAP